MVRENFQISAVHISGKCILTHALYVKFPQVLIIAPQREGSYSFHPRQRVFENLSSQQKGGKETMG